MRRLILLLDGTWNEPETDTDTNIVRLRSILTRSLWSAAGRKRAADAATDAGTEAMVSSFKSPDDIENLVLYERGVGTAYFEKWRGGVLGLGLDTNIRRAYRFLSFHFQPGDQIFVFGFSRGAYTARSLVGYIAAAGLLKARRCTPELESLAWEFYRTTINDRMPGVWHRIVQNVHPFEATKIACLGVFDTVGALGVPFRYFRKANRQRYEFHTVELSSITHVNLHAVAVDEYRWPFQATLWRRPPFKQFKTTTEQVWFPGSHGDIGGGWIPAAARQDEAKIALDDLSLDWMLKRVKFHYPDFPCQERGFGPINEKWALAPQHDARRWHYRLIWPKARRSMGNRGVRPGGFWQTEVGRDRHAEPVSERVHMGALYRLGHRVPYSGVPKIYAPRALCGILEVIEDEYRRRLSAPSIGVVDWNGEMLSPDVYQERELVIDSIAGARERLGAAGIR